MLVGCDGEIWFRLTDDFQWVVTNSNMGSKYITIVKLNVLGQEINNSLEIEDLKRTKIISKKNKLNEQFHITKRSMLIMNEFKEV